MIESKQIKFIGRFSLKAFIALFLLFTSFGEIFSQSKNSDHIYSKAQLFFEEGEYDSALMVVKTELLFDDSPRNLNLLGNCYYQKFRFDSANYFYDKALDLNSDSQFSVEEKIRSLIGKGRIEIRLREPQRVAAYLPSIKQLVDRYSLFEYLPYAYSLEAYANIYTDESKADRLYKSAIDAISSDNPDIIDFYVNYIDFLIEKRSSRQAKVYLDRALLLAENFKEHEVVYWDLLLEKGYFLFRIGELQKSVNVYDLELFPLVENEKTDWAKYTLAEYYRMSSWPKRNLKNTIKALEYNKKYLEIIKDFHNSDFVRYFEIYSYIASIYSDLEFIELSSEYTNKAIDISQRLDRQGNILKAKYNKGVEDYKLGNRQKALSNFNEVIDHPSSIKSFRGFKILSKKYRCWIFLENGEIEKAKKDAIDFKREFIGLYETNVGRLIKDGVLIHANNTYLKVLLRLKDQEKIKEIFEELISINGFEGYMDDAVLMEFCNNYSNYLIEHNHLDSANNLLNKILKHDKNHIKSTILKTNSRKSQQLLKTLSLKGKFFKQKYSANRLSNELDSAYIYYTKSVDFTKVISEGYKSAQDHIIFFKNQEEVFENAIAISYQKYMDSKDFKYVQQIFEFVELIKSNALLKSLNHSKAISQLNIPDSVLFNINSLKKQSIFLNGEIAKLERKDKLEIAEGNQLRDLQFSLTKNKAAVQEVMSYLEQEYPNYFQLTYKSQTATIELVQKNLNENEALINYHVEKDYTYTFTITKDTVYLNRLSTVSRKMLKHFRKTIQPEYFSINIDSAHSDYITLASKIYEYLLFTPLNNFSSRKISKIYVLPDRELGYLPFGSLLTEQLPVPNSIPYADLPYLLKKYTISYGYSASILFGNKEESHNMGFNRLLAIAPSYGKFLKDTTMMRSLGKFRDSFKELTFNKKEVDYVGQYFKGTVYKNDRATKEAFINQLKDHDIIHLAMHAFVDNEEPNYSKLIFTPRGDTLTDSYLHNFELYNMDIPARMAVLSACNTADGELEGGEGVMSLARAFTYAGTQSVVMSHWRVDDKAGSLIMKDFYKNLSEGMTKDDALRKAKLSYLSDENLHHLKRHPFFWSNFVVMGDVSSLVEDDNPSYIFVLSLVLIIIFLSLLMFKYHKIIRGYFLNTLNR